MSPLPVDIFEGPGSQGTASCPPPYFLLVFPSGLPWGREALCPAVIPPAWELLEDPASNWATGRSRLAFPLQYYEMSYGLNIEMHKQVTVLGVSVR